MTGLSWVYTERVSSPSIKKPQSLAAVKAVLTSSSGLGSGRSERTTTIFPYGDVVMREGLVASPVLGPGGGAQGGSGWGGGGACGAPGMGGGGGAAEASIACCEFGIGDFCEAVMLGCLVDGRIAMSSTADGGGSGSEEGALLWSL